VSTEAAPDLGWLLPGVVWTVASATCLLGSAEEGAERNAWARATSFAVFPWSRLLFSEGWHQARHSCTPVLACGQGVKGAEKLVV
jgi:hypothetical protein